mmetsp:Transcript_45709/g.177969  ORF Transcript_45709/g.177969 Transcript_45709/m.177969 type:complete len:142 (-) Transcript_45709:685-1110(-)
MRQPQGKMTSSRPKFPLTELIGISSENNPKEAAENGNTSDLVQAHASYLLLLKTSSLVSTKDGQSLRKVSTDRHWRPYRLPFSFAQKASKWWCAILLTNRTSFSGLDEPSDVVDNLCALINLNYLLIQNPLLNTTQQKPHN